MRDSGQVVDLDAVIVWTLDVSTEFDKELLKESNAQGHNTIEQIQLERKMFLQLFKYDTYSTQGDTAFDNSFLKNENFEYK